MGCYSINKSDLKYLCEGQCHMINNSDLKICVNQAGGHKKLHGLTKHCSGWAIAHTLQCL